MELLYKSYGRPSAGRCTGHPATLSATSGSVDGGQDSAVRNPLETHNEFTLMRPIGQHETMASGPRSTTFGNYKRSDAVVHAVGECEEDVFSVVLEFPGIGQQRNQF